MKNIVSKVICLLFVALYIVSTMGYSVHHCNMDGTSDVEIMFIDNNLCEHSHTGCSEHSHSCEHHNSNCCSTTVLVLTPDQVVNASEDSFDIPILYIPFLQLFIGDDCNSVALFKHSFDAKYTGVDDAFVQQSIIITNSTLRV